MTRIVSIPYRNAQEVAAYLVNVSRIDIVELRLDYASSIDYDALCALRAAHPIPMMFTLRSATQGGYYPHDENTRQQDLLRLATHCHPEYMDIEYHVPIEITDTLSQHTRLVLSYHDFEKTPDNLSTLLQSLCRPHIYAYKIATTAHSTLDALRLLQFGYQQKQYRLTLIGMGEYGQSTRILSPIINNAMQYVAIDSTHQTASGQMTAHELDVIYHANRLSANTRIYALLGDPVDRSLGHILHNQAIRYLNIDAVYVKWRITPDELPEAMRLLKTLPVAGLSITMPLKNHFADTPVNTVTIENGKWHYSNTDGLGAYRALLHYIDPRHKTIVILGAGGAAHAIAEALVKHGANVIILNRTVARAATLAKRLSCEYGALHDLASLRGRYHIIINTLPTMDAIQENDLSSSIYAMDSVYQPIHTPFLQMAAATHNTIIPGYQMFIEQALLQIHAWFHPDDVALQAIRQQMMSFFRSATNLLTHGS